MPVLPQNTPPNGGKKPGSKWAQRSKQLSLWVLIILIPVLFLQLQSGKNDQAPNVRYDQYTQELDRDNISIVTIQSGSEISCVFKQKVLIGGMEVQKFYV